MLSVVLAATITVAGFSYDAETVSDRSKPIKAASRGEDGVWKEHAEIVVGTSPEDRDFSDLMRKQEARLLDGFYNEEPGQHVSFDTYEAAAGWVDVSEHVIAASRDLVSVATDASFYYQGMAHPNRHDGAHLNWSRRLHRLLSQDDVFALAPDTALRRLALSRFDNPKGLQNPDDPNGIPLSWSEASIGPDGITWSFGPYELGGYASGGNAMIPWSLLKPYLRPDLPFVIGSIRAAPE